MAFALGPIKIQCTNCKYKGKSEVKGGGCGAMVGGGLIALVGCVVAVALGNPFIGLAVVAIGIVILLAGMFGPAKHICPRCKWEHPIRLE
jgi:hypothetical protein